MICALNSAGAKSFFLPKTGRHAESFIGEMRTVLAAVCVHALEPVLIILDEFQRFPDLLRPDNPTSNLARHLFAWEDARVLLLSATPYKMLTLFVSRTLSRPCAFYRTMKPEPKRSRSCLPTMAVRARGWGRTG